MTDRPPRRRLVRRLFVGQVLVVLVGAATLGAVSFLVAPPIFHDHVRRAVGPVSDVVGHHLDQALSETLLLALVIGIAASMAAAAAVSWLLAIRIARPIEQLSDAADELASGRLDARAPWGGADDELGDLTVAFNAMADALERTEQTRRRLLSDLAHELRTPLATLEAYHEALVDGVADADADTWATLQEATARLQRLVEDVSLVSRAEEGRLPLRMDLLDLREVVDAAVDAVGPSAHERGVALVVDAPDAPLRTVGDPDRLAQVMGNLLRNALEHTTVQDRVTVTVVAEGGEVRVDVADTGEGIAPEHLPHLFDRFYRADPSRQRPGGSGIGLTISRAIARGHGGDLTADSAGLGRGASFTLYLPAAANQPPAGEHRSPR